MSEASGGLSGKQPVFGDVSAGFLRPSGLSRN